MQNHALRAAAAIAALTAFSASPLLAQNPCFDPNIGTDLMLGDDQLSTPQALGFTFPYAGGGTTTDIEVSSNGFVNFEPGNGSDCCNGDIAEFLADPARFAMNWHDLSPNQRGAVYFNAVPGKAIVSFVDVPEFNQQGSNTMQLQLFPNGEMQLWIAGISDPGTHSALIGVTPGNGAADPGEVDLTGAPFDSGAEPTIYEFFDISTDTRDYGGRGWLFSPNMSGGFTVVPIGPCATVAPFGDGCPTSTGATFHELFDANNAVDVGNFAITLAPNTAGGYDVAPVGSFDTNFSNNLLAGDDQLLTNNALGFTIQVPGAGSVSAIDIDSNGWIAPTGLFLGSDLSESVQQFVDEGTRWALLWDDLNPANSGGVYFDTFPGMAMVTWDMVPEYSATGANTAQIQFRADGSVVMAWQSITTADFLAGFSAGNGLLAVAADITAAPFSTDGFVALAHTASAPPGLGQTIDLILDNVPQSQLATALNLGTTTTPPIDLTILGAPGCFVLVDALVALPMPAPNAMGRSLISTPIPNDVNLIGVSLQSQGVYGDITNPPNALGVGVSNGLSATFGF